MKVNNPLVSVVIPTYNRAHLVCNAIDSVLNQSFTDFEILIVDDHSEDDTAEKVKGYKDPRVTYLINERKKGAQGARNTGILSSDTKYIAFLDSDDEWLPGKLEKQVEIFEKRANVDLVYTGQINSYKDETTTKTYRRAKQNYFAALLKENCIGTVSSVMVKRTSFIKVGLFDEKLPAKQDLDMWLRVAKDHRIHCISEPLIKKNEFDTFSENRVYNLENRIEGSLMILQKYKDHYKANKKIYAKNLYRIAKDMYLNKERRFLFYLFKSFLYNPGLFIQRFTGTK